MHIEKHVSENNGTFITPTVNKQSLFFNVFLLTVTIVPMETILHCKLLNLERLFSTKGNYNVSKTFKI